MYRHLSAYQILLEPHVTEILFESRMLHQTKTFRPSSNSFACHRRKKPPNNYQNESTPRPSMIDRVDLHTAVANKYFSRCIFCVNSWMIHRFILMVVDSNLPGTSISSRVTCQLHLPVASFLSHANKHYSSFVNKYYEGPCCRGVSKGPERVVALTRYRGLQFCSLYLRQGESLPHVIDEGKKKYPAGSRSTIQGIDIYG